MLYIHFYSIRFATNTFLLVGNHMHNCKRGRPCKNIKDKARLKHLTVPAEFFESLNNVEHAGISISTLLQFAIVYADELVKFNEIPLEFKKRNYEDLRNYAKTLADFTLFENETYIETKQLETEEINIELNKKIAEFLENLINTMFRFKNRYKFKEYDAIKAIKECVEKDPTGEISLEQVDFFLTHRPDGRSMILEGEEPYHLTKEEISIFVESILQLDPPGLVSIGNVEMLTKEN